MEKIINKRLHGVILAYLDHESIKILKGCYAHGSDNINFITMDNEELVFVNTATKCKGYDMSMRSPTRSAPSALQQPTSLSPRNERVHQHPLRHREPFGDGVQKDPPVPPQERP